MIPTPIATGGCLFIREDQPIAFDDAPPANNAAPTAIHVATPSGKSAFVAPDSIVPLANASVSAMIAALLGLGIALVTGPRDVGV